MRKRSRPGYLEMLFADIGVQLSSGCDVITGLFHNDHETQGNKNPSNFLLGWKTEFCSPIFYRDRIQSTEFLKRRNSVLRTEEWHPCRVHGITTSAPAVIRN
ncbi:hypothetical protein AVEN_149050-1 [Araneus ventricosus]|uniref:Uncharacterized protein n=1 Tax=Araneus ventricosus TaxID=182803 RepID=A0A4Y2DA05_ARAVE|nr:hypothetical protein AVEN_110766-1 [Araneus ventricosus]GBM12936.1 hypothetical protein AVEN_149050-1 [Araneus ventricosus]